MPFPSILLIRDSSNQNPSEQLVIPSRQSYRESNGFLRFEGPILRRLIVIISLSSFQRTAVLEGYTQKSTKHNEHLVGIKEMVFMVVN